MTAGGGARSVGRVNPIAFIEAHAATRRGVHGAFADPLGRTRTLNTPRARRRAVRMRFRALAATLAIAAGMLVLAGVARGVDGTLELASQPSGIADPDTADAFFVGASADGSRVFIETAQKLTADDTDTGRYDVYERAGGVTTLVSQPTGVADQDTADVGFRGASADGGRVFLSTTQKLTPDDTDTARADIYERTGGVTRLVSQPTGVADPDTDDAFFERASRGGGRVFFSTTQKMTADDMDTARADTYERAGGLTRLVSQPTGVADPNTSGANLKATSDDGSRIFFESSQKLTVDDTDTNRDDVYERAGGVTMLVSQPAGVIDPDTNLVFLADTSADGSRVFFNTTQKMTADDMDSGRVDTYERAGGVTTLVTKPTGVPDPDKGNVNVGTASANGTRYFFETSEKLTADDVDTGRTDVYERAGGVTTLVTKPTGVPDPDSADASFRAISADGSRVFFETDQRLTADDTDTGRTDIYERAGGVTTLVSKPVGVTDPDTAGVFLFGASDGGNRVFLETSQRMTANDNDSGRTDVFAAGSPDPSPPPPQQPGSPTTGGGPPPPGLLPGPCANQSRGTGGRDVLDGTAAGDTLRGLAGSDRLNGFAGDDCLFGGGGNDRLLGGTGKDRLSGGPGRDRLSGGPGADRLSGGKGANSISAGPGNDVINSANGRPERILCGRGRDSVRADRSDTLRGCERSRRV